MKKVVLFGGNPADATVWTLDGTRWSNLAGSSPPARSHHSMAYDEAGKRLTLAGGVWTTIGSE